MIWSAWWKWSDWIKFPLQDQSGASSFTNVVLTAAKPTGYYPPGAYALPIKAGEMAAWPTGSGDVAATMLLGKLMSASLSGVGSVTANAGLVIGMNAALTGSGTLSGAMAARLNMIAAINGGGSVTGTLSGIANLTANLSCVGTAAGSTMTGIGYMYCDITTAGAALTAAAIAAAVWDEPLASHTDPGSAGAALAAAGSAGDPWSTVLPGSYSGSQAGALFYQGYQLARNRVVTDPSTGVMTVYADDNTTTLFTANIYNDASGLAPYDGTGGINRKDRMT